MSTQTREITTTFTETGCIPCGARFFLPDWLESHCRDGERSFWCPACGRSLSYKTTEKQKLQQQVTALKGQATFARGEARRQREHRQAADRRVTAMKGVVTKTKKRIAKGKCTRCTHEFPDLAAHMAEVHPDYAPEAE